MKLVEKLSYKPTELTFGTSGLRGLVTDMTDLECYINVAGFLDYLESNGDITPGSDIFVAGDLRDSTPRILGVVEKAVSDKGCTAKYCGLIPTPAMAFYAQQNQAPCIMVTGSHIPADRNGIKFYKKSGEVLKDDEAGIKGAVAKVRQKLYDSELKSSGFEASGELQNRPELPPLATHAEKVYIERYTQISGRPLEGRQVVVYQHSAVGRDLLVTVLEALGAKVTPVGRSDVFVPIDTENVTPDNKAYFKSLSQQYPGIFAIVSTDGDSDRPFVIDENGEFYRGDVVGCLVAKELGATYAAIPISSNDAADSFMTDNHIAYEHTKIGSPYVIKAMNASQEKIKVGWEVNGGFLLGTTITYKGVVLETLPTRDAILPIIVTLLAANDNNQSLSDFFKQLPSRFTGGGLIDVTSTAVESFRTLAQDQPRAESLIAEEINDPVLGTTTSVDLTDGIRIKFSSNNIIHIRPSGNAPQLRIYTNCDSQESADELAIKATEPGGLLERFISAAQKNSDL